MYRFDTPDEYTLLLTTGARTVAARIGFDDATTSLLVTLVRSGVWRLFSGARFTPLRRKLLYNPGPGAGHDVIVEVAGADAGGRAADVRAPVTDDRGQTHLTAAAALVQLERLLRLRRAAAGAGPRLPRYRSAAGPRAPRAGRSRDRRHPLGHAPLSGTRRPSMTAPHVILGTGPVGCWTARALRDLQINRCELVNRTGQRPELLPADVELIAADGVRCGTIDGALLRVRPWGCTRRSTRRTISGTSTSQGCRRPPWTAATATGARYVSMENLYMYDASKPITEDSPIAAAVEEGRAPSGRMAAEVMAAHRRGEIRATALRSSDYYGPGVTGSALGEMVAGRLAAGKKPQVGGSATQPHSWAYIEDVGRAAALLGARDEAVGTGVVRAASPPAPRARWSTGRPGARRAGRVHGHVAVHDAAGRPLRPGRRG